MRASTFSKSDLPEAYLARMSNLLGDEYADFLKSYNFPATTGLRVNTLKLSPEDFKQLSPFSISALPWCPSGFIVDAIQIDNQSPSPGKHPYHSAGLYYLQEPSAMAAVEALAPLPGERVLDLAAAPGGKTTHMAGMMKNSGLLVANEIHPKRVWNLAENLERCGVRNAILTNENPTKLADHFGALFDRVLVDAPCSGEGMMRKSETARNEWKPELVNSCAQRQNAILNDAARLVKPGGWLTYTTCTFSSEENESVIANFLNDHPEFELKGIPPSPGYKFARPEWVGLPQMHPLNRAVRLWPHHLSGEGHFIALLYKNESNDISRTDVSLGKRTLPNMFTKSILNRNMFRLVDDFFQENLSYSLHPQQLIISGSYIYHPPDYFPDLTGLKVIHPGWWLGSINKGRFTPSHTLALGITSDQARREVHLSIKSREVFSYLVGESFPDPGEDGWVLVTVEGFPLGWGKRVKGVVKNYYPHGIRWQIKFQDKFMQQ